MREIGKRDCALVQSTQLKTSGRLKTGQRKLPLSTNDCVSNLGESAVVHRSQMVLSFGDKSEMGDNDPAVARTVEKFPVNGCDTAIIQQKKETRIAGGLLVL